jgi:signal transduction histidine kinase
MSDFDALPRRLAASLKFEALIGELLAHFVDIPSRDVDSAIGTAQERLCRLLDLDLSTVWQWTSGSPRYMKLTHLHRPPGGQPAPDRGDAQELLPWGLARALAKQTVVLSSVDDLPPEAVVDRETQLRFGVKSAVGLPLSIGGGPVLGVVTFATTRETRDWTDDMIRRLELITRIFAAALGRKATDEALHESESALRDLSQRLIRAHEEERALLARELHDDLTQRLAVLAIEIGRAELAASSGAQAGALRVAREGLVALSEDVHSLAYQLHPSVLEDLGLVEALRTECERFQRQCRPTLTTTFEPLTAAPGADAALCLFRVAQEALRNVARHSGAPSAALALREENGGFLLAVKDDGAGFDPAVQKERRSLGLASMRERVRLASGTLRILSAPGQGTTISAWVPAGGGRLVTPPAGRALSRRAPRNR